MKMSGNAGCKFCAEHRMAFSRRAISVRTLTFHVIWILLLLVKHGTCQSGLTQDFYTEEEQPVGTYIGTIGEGLPDVSPPYIAWFTQEGSENDLEISDFGQITVKTQLDRERRDSYSIVAVAGSGNNIQITVHVLDINDHSPVFNQSVMTKEILESAPPDAKFPLGSAIDPDLDLNSTQSYEIVDGNTDNAFRLGTKRASNGILYLDLEMNGALDYEHISDYHLTINASDGGIPPRSGSMYLHITVVDVNDNQPIFNSSRYYAQMPENATIGARVLQVFAMDEDSGENGNILYHIDRQRSDQDEHFAINPITGLLTVNRDLDYENQPSYELIVVAQDNGTQKLQTTAIVSVMVTDVNDNEPTISIIFLTENGEPRISELTEPGNFVARISVNDPDDEVVTVDLDGGDGHFALQTRDNIVFLVVLDQPVDHEQQSSYTLTIIATDSGDPPLQAKETFTLTVIDTNDNPPTFTQMIYYAEVLEIVPIGSVVTQVTAIDDDYGSNSQLTYTLEDTPETNSDWFSVESTTGLITTKERLVCDTESEPRLLIVATDSGVPIKSATATVSIRIKDVNDNQPVFDQSFYNVSIPESQVIDSCILQVSATDPDCGASGEITYSIAVNLGFELPQEFVVRNTTGQICVSRSLDYENKHRYEFPVLARDQDGLETTAMVKISIADINDNIPIFYPWSYSVYLDQATNIGSEVVAVHASDLDSGSFGTITYSITSGNSGGYFNINSQTGIITLRRQPPGSQQNLKVRATDGGGRSSSGDADVSIIIIDSSQQPPVFPSVLYQFTIPESAAPGTPVSSVFATNTDPSAGSITYSIKSGNLYSLFSIGITSGQIQTNGELDHETVPFVLLTVEAQSGNPPSYGRAQVNISINDVNDNIPSFPVDTVEIPVKEDTAVGTAIYYVQAEDLDSSSNGIIRYSIQDSSDKFEINEDSGQLRLRATLDYESVPTHNLFVVARDLGLPAQSSTMTIIVDVQDVNDNTPQFTQDSYSANVLETISLNTQIIHVSAMDRDSGNNGRITYLLKPSIHSSLFGIYPDTGYVYNQAELDREDNERYTLTVIAMDNGIPAQSSTAQVIVNLLDENDNNPTFQQMAYEFLLAENEPSGTAVGYVSATDPDVTDNFAIHYSLASSSPFFAVEELTGKIITKQPLDREEQEMHQIFVEASDGGSSPRTASVEVKIAVADINDNSPIFGRPGPYTESVEENLPKGTFVLQVAATDKDLPPSNVMHYSFPEDDNEDAEMFSIHPLTGRITTKEVLDHERQSLYTFRVTAKDSGTPTRSTDTIVEVAVIDKNESPPEFDNPKIYLDVVENTPPGTTVGNVRASDPDSGENAVIMYYIIDGNLFGTFTINRTTGDLIVERPVDYEMSSSYTIVVRAVDSSVVNPMSSTGAIEITVIDINDNVPLFELDPIVIMDLPENTPIGTNVFTFSALDYDSGDFGRILYTIVSQSPENAFIIDATTGVMKVNRLIDYEQTRQFSVIIQAADQPENMDQQQSSTVTAVIWIKDVNDNTPVFQTRESIIVMEDEPVGYPIIHVIATDADDHENARISYAITSGNEKGHFALDSTSGLLTIQSMLDYEDVSTFHLNISARDHGFPQRVGYMQFTVNVKDINDNSPVFEYPIYNATVPENTNIGTFVMHIQASDADAGVNAQLTYLIPSGLAESNFQIGSATGDISTNRTLDREEASSWVLTAYVRDAAYPARYDSTTVQVTVLDVNDNAPVFQNPLYYLEVPENMAIDLIHTVVAEDADAGLNGSITYSISAGNIDGKFAIDPQTGELSCQQLDREVRATYDLTIRATDSGYPAQLSSSTISVSVLDDNDNFPEFTQPFYSRSIPEDIAVGTSILQVTAVDADDGVNALVTYSLNNTADGLFKIDNTTGTIHTTGNFDREKTASYSFNVYAIDGGTYGPRMRSARIDITLEDVNDNTPIFDQIPFSFNISQSLGIGQFVGQVQASDADAGSFGDVSYSFLTSSQYFEMDSSSGVITTRQSLAAVSNIQSLEVVARDNGSPVKSSTGLVVIGIGNIAGMSALQFTSSSYQVSLLESANIGTTVQTVRAEFINGGSGSIRYTFISGNDDYIFYISETSGTITVSNSDKLDYETTPSIRLIVKATANTAVGYATVWVNLNDVNDNVPQFMQSRYVSSVWEGNSRGTYVMQVRASDADTGPNGQVTYTIIGGNVQNAFVIDPPNTGIVKTNIILDREILASYRLEVEAMDEGNPPLSSTCILSISVIDVNDNAPFFPQYPPLSVPEGTQLGTQLLQVTANDRDLNPVLTYEFTADGNPGNVFSIDRYSGRIAVAKQLDYETQRTYALKIKASDEEHEVLSDIIVNLVDENDNPPVFTQSSYDVMLPELTALHTSIVSVTATDRDDGQNGNVTYSMLWLGGFYINPLTGVIYTNQTVVFNPAQPTLHLVVTANDQGTPALSAVIAVRIQVTDVNNNAPQFNQSSYTKQLREDQPVGESVLQVLATDADDSHLNSKIDYSIVGGNVGETFQISSSTGDIFLTAPLNREVMARYQLSVMARDNGQPPLDSVATVVINVDDVNDNAPTFTVPEYEFEVAEDTQIGTSVFEVTAIDVDAGPNGDVRYSIASGNDDGKFDLNPQSGVLTIRQELDREVKASHRLTVKATDSSTDFPQLSSFTTVIVTVKDVNEFWPMFPIRPYLESVLENQPIGTTVFIAHANDQDGGAFGNEGLQYYITSDQPYFEINRYTGVVTTAYVFNYEAAQTFRFDIRVQDAGSRQSTVPVQIQIESAADIQPVFGSKTYSFTVPGNAVVGYRVGMVEATDADGATSSLIKYHFREEHEYFSIHETTGFITVIKNLTDSSNEDTADRRRRKRFVTAGDRPGIPIRVRRALMNNSVTLLVVASSGSLSGSWAEASIELAINRSCDGCALSYVGASEGGFRDWHLVLVVVFVIIAIILGVGIVIMYIRGRERKRQPPVNSVTYGGSFDGMDIHPPPLPRDMPPTYNEIHNYPHAQRAQSHDHTMTTSELSDQSHSASSGRGSAEDGDDVDEEIRMINATPLQQPQNVRVNQDSGIAPDDDIVSLQSVQNHQEYLARLGIDTSKLKNAPTQPAHAKLPPVGSSVESMHQFAEEGGGEDIDVPPPSVPSKYHHMPEMEVEEHVGDNDGTHEFRYIEKGPTHADSLSSVINSEEEFSGSYNWDYLLDWGPQYQPLAHVFSEIAKLKDDSIKPPKKQATHIVPQRPKPVGFAPPQVNKNLPPPLLTNAPPQAILAQPVSMRPGQIGASPPGSSRSGGSARTSQMTSLPSLPRSPISHDSSFTSPPMSPSYTPSLSPLATRSPSISPLQQPSKGSNSSGHSSGDVTPQRSRRNDHAHFVSLGTSESEQEIHI